MFVERIWPGDIHAFVPDDFFVPDDRYRNLPYSRL